MANPREEFSDWTFGQLAAVGHALGGPEAARRIVRDDSLRKQVARLIASAEKSVNPIADSLPTEMTISGCVYEILPLLKEGEESMKIQAMLKRVKKMQGRFGGEDLCRTLTHQNEIPAELRGKTIFLFVDGRSADGFLRSAYVEWSCGAWVKCLHWPGSAWFGRARILRRKF